MWKWCGGGRTGTARLLAMGRNKPSIGLLRARGQRLPYFHVFAQHARPRLACKDVAVLVDGAELWPAAGRGCRIAALVEDEVLDPAVLGVADPDALLEARIVDVVRFRIEHVDHVVVVDREGDPARHAELIPARQKLAVLVEDLDARVRAIAHEQAVALVHGDAVRGPELARRVAGLAPGFDELAVLGKL